MLRAFVPASLRRLILWCLALAMALGSVLPALSHAMVAASVDQGDRVQVCTATGMAWVAAADREDPASDSAPAAACPWCAFHAGAQSWLPSQAVLALPPAPRQLTLAARALAPPWQRILPSGARPRAPPHAA